MATIKAFVFLLGLWKCGFSLGCLWCVKGTTPGRGQAHGPPGLCQGHMAWNLLCPGAGRQRAKGLSVWSKQKQTFLKKGLKEGLERRDIRREDLSKQQWSKFSECLVASVGTVLESSGVNVWVSSEVQIFGRFCALSYLYFDIQGHDAELEILPLLAGWLGFGRVMSELSLTAWCLQLNGGR